MTRQRRIIIPGMSVLALSFLAGAERATAQFYEPVRKWPRVGVWDIRLQRAYGTLGCALTASLGGAGSIDSILLNRSQHGKTFWLSLVGLNLEALNSTEFTVKIDGRVIASAEISERVPGTIIFVSAQVSPALVRSLMSSLKHSNMLELDARSPQGVKAYSAPVSDGTKLASLWNECTAAQDRMRDQ